MKKCHAIAIAAGVFVAAACHGADLTVSGNYTVASGGESYDNVTVTATATISGGRLTVAEGGTITVSAGTASFTCPITMGTSAGTITIAPAANATADFTGKISGPADIDIRAAASSGIVKFTSSDSDYDGNLTLSKGKFHAKGNGAFGSTNGTSTFIALIENEAYVYFDGFTTSEDIIVSPNSSGHEVWNDKRVFFTADCTFNGAFTDGPYAGAEWGWDFTNGITVTFNGSFSGFSNVMGAATAACTATINFNCSPSYSGNWYWQACVLNFYQRRTSGTTIALRGGTYNFHVANHFVSTGNNTANTLRFENNSAATLNLINGEQQFTRLYEQGEGNSVSSVISSPSGQTFCLLNNTSYASVYAGKFSGSVNLSVLGSKTLTLKGQNDTTGTLSLSNSAKVVMAAGSDWKGKLAFQNADGTQQLTLDEDILVGGLHIAGSDMPNGVYGSSSSSAPSANQLNCFAGSGTVRVVRDLEIDADYVVPAGGETCHDVRVLANATITGGKLTILGGGLSVAAGKTARFENEVSFGEAGASGTLAISPAAGATVRFVGKLTGPSDIEVRADSLTGIVRFEPGSGVTSDFDGNITVIRGEFHAAGDSALGSTNGYTRCVNTLTGGVLDNKIFIDGMTTSETLYLSRGELGWQSNYQKTICFTANCTFNGPILPPTPQNEFGWDFTRGIKIVFNGGLGSSEYPFGGIMGDNSGTTNPAEFDFNCSPYVNANWYWLGGVNNMNNPVFGSYATRFRGGVYHLNCANVFRTESGTIKNMYFETANAVTFDLVTGDQAFTHIVEGATGHSTASVITSATGQTFELANSSANSTFRGKFSGDVNLRVLGNKTVNLYGESDSTGTLVLSNSAKVVFASGSKWSGKVAFQDDTGNQTLTLNNGGMMVSELTVGGVKLPAGEYGSASSGVAAENQKAFLAGTGILIVGAAYGELVITDATYQVAAGGETYSGVIVSNNATVTGGPLTVLQGGTIAVAAGKTAQFENEVSFGRDGIFETILAPEAGATNIFSGKLTGPANIGIRAADNTGTVFFVPGAGVTNDFDGNLTVYSGTFHVAGDSALGSTNGYTYFFNTYTGTTSDNIISFDGLSTYETIYLTRGNVGYLSNDITPIRFTADCTFNGPVLPPEGSYSEYGWRFANGITINFNGGFGLADRPYTRVVGTVGTSTATINFNSSPCASTIWYWQSCNMNMYCPLLGNAQLRFRGGTYHLHCANAFVNTAGNSKEIIFEIGDPYFPLTLDLVSGSQKFSSLSAANTAHNSSNTVFTSATAQDFHLDAASGTSAFHGLFTGNINLFVDAAQTLTLSRANTSTGTLALTNGAKVVFTPTGSWAGRISIAGNGDEKLTLSGAASAAQLVVGGQTLAPGWYGPTASTPANRLACIDGEGLLAVGLDGATDGVWTAGAGSSSTGIEQGGNWESGSEPDGASGLAAVTFATAGTAAGITHDVFWRQIAFSSAVPFFRLYGDGGGITLAEGVSVESDGTQPLSYEIAAPLTTVGTQTWSVPSNVTLAVTGDLHGAPGTEIVCDGLGTYSFSGANSDTAAGIRLQGKASLFPKTAKALGSAAGATTHEGAGYLILDNIETDEPFVFAGERSVYRYVSLRQGTNVLSGPLSVHGAVYFDDFRNGDRLVLSGGIDFDVVTTGPYFRFAWKGNGNLANPFQVEISGAVTNSGSNRVVLYNEGVCDIILSAPNNRFTGTGDLSTVYITRSANNAGEPVARLFCKVPFACNYSDELLLGYPAQSSGAYCGLIDLCGNDQGFAKAYGQATNYQAHVVNGKPQGAYSIVTSSDGPALLCSRHAEDASTWWTFTGAAGYRMEGTGGITFKTSSESTGALCVTNGTMTIPAGVTWKNCSKVEASGAGTFRLEESRAFGPGTEVRLSGNGKMNLAAGVQATAGFLFLDGNANPLLGEWGSPESGAQHTSSHFTGTGKIRFGAQFIIIMR